MLDRQAKVAEMYLKGSSQDAIAKALSTTQATVSNDLAACREKWKEESVGAFDERLATELRRIDMVEEAAWGGWERSMRDQETIVNRVDTVPIREAPIDDDPNGHGPRNERIRQRLTTPVGSKATMTVLRATEETVRKGQIGDPRFLDKVAWCIDTRLRILGAYKEQKQQNTIVQINFDAMTERTPIDNDPLEKQIAAVGSGSKPNPIVSVSDGSSPEKTPTAGAG